MDLKAINKKLLQEYGTIPGRTEPLFKIVPAGEQMEIRIGEFSEWCGKIFVRTVSGAHRVFKYQTLRNCLVLERWFPAWNAELPETYGRGGYEGIYFFADKHGNPLPLRWDVAKIVCKTSLDKSGGVMLDGRKEGHRGKSSFDAEDRETFEREVQYFEQEFENESPLLSHDGGIVVPSSYSKD